MMSAIHTDLLGARIKLLGGSYKGMVVGIIRAIHFDEHGMLSCVGDFAGELFALNPVEFRLVKFAEAPPPAEQPESTDARPMAEVQEIAYRHGPSSWDVVVRKHPGVWEYAVRFGCGQGKYAKTAATGLADKINRCESWSVHD